MIKDPRHGWCSFQVDHFIGRASYLTDVPFNLLEAFIDYFCNRKYTGCVHFDEEGSFFNLILTPYTCYIIEDRETDRLIPLSLSAYELAGDLIEDLKADLDAWVYEFDFYEDESNEELTKKFYKQRKTKMKKLINKLEKFFVDEENYYSSHFLDEQNSDNHIASKDNREKKEEEPNNIYDVLKNNIILNKK